MIRLCKQCADMAHKHGVLDKVVRLCHNKSWLCPYGREICGSVNGKTQNQLREEFFLAGLCEMIAEPDPKKWE